MDDKKEKQEELKYLYKLYHDRDEEFEKAKGKRAILTILGFSAFYLLLFWKLREPEGWDILGTIVTAAILGAIHFVVNACVFVPLCDMGRSESDRLKRIKEQIQEIEKELYR